jgi:conjugal transfer pilin signal peptidase TrbI
MSPTTIIPHVLTALVSIALTLTIVIWTQPVGLPNGIVTIDASEAVLRFINAGGREMPEADYATEALRYQEFLEAAIDEFAARNSVIVVNGAAVLAGAPDITDMVAEDALRLVLERGGRP